MVQRSSDGQMRSSAEIHGSVNDPAVGLTSLRSGRVERADEAPLSVCSETVDSENSRQQPSDTVR